MSNLIEILCSSCGAEKQIGNTHPKKSRMSTSRPLELLNMDLFGPTSYTSISANKYGFVSICLLKVHMGYLSQRQEWSLQRSQTICQVKWKWVWIKTQENEKWQ